MGKNIQTPVDPMAALARSANKVTASSGFGASLMGVFGGATRMAAAVNPWRTFHPAPPTK